MLASAHAPHCQGQIVESSGISTFLLELPIRPLPLSIFHIAAIQRCYLPYSSGMHVFPAITTPSAIERRRSAHASHYMTGTAVTHQDDANSISTTPPMLSIRRPVVCNLHGVLSACPGESQSYVRIVESLTPLKQDLQVLQGRMVGVFILFLFISTSSVPLWFHRNQVPTLMYLGRTR